MASYDGGFEAMRKQRMSGDESRVIYMEEMMESSAEGGKEFDQWDARNGRYRSSISLKTYSKHEKGSHVHWRPSYCEVYPGNPLRWAGPYKPCGIEGNRVQSRNG